MANSVNEVTLLGNLTRDPEVKHTPKGDAILKITIATNRSYKQNDEWKEVAEFHNVEKWGAEKLAEYLRKGSKVYIKGRLQTDQFEKDGVKTYYTKIVAFDIILLDKREAREEREPEDNTSADGMQVEPSDLPF
jgi:single-strand DNA-binding protein